jgi:uncharacterized protein involved in exopolysaccharide biosynthesis
MLPSTKDRRDGSREGWQGWQRGQRDDLTLSEAGHVLWEWRVLVAACTILFVAIALAYVRSGEPVYTADATISVRLEEGIGVADNFQEILAGLRNSEATRGLVEEAAERAGWEAGPLDFDQRLEREPVNNEEVEVRFSAPTPEEAARGANAYADVFVERLEELKGRLAGGTVAVDADVAEAAEPPEWRSGPRLLLAALAAGGSGFLVGGIAALILDGRTRQWRGSRDAELTLRAPVLGVIPDYSDDPTPGDGGAG